ncbi:DUF58 domain-containing protein [Flavobacterium aurantiibacter]|nr:DUF58 domain-containing protein [Flavobacterium aurantiibacter]
MKRLNRIFNLVPTNRFFFGMALLIVLFVLSFFFSQLFYSAVLLSIFFCGLLGYEILRLFGLKKPIRVQRKVAEKISNGDKNPVQLLIQSTYNFPIQLKVIDELPFLLQIRNFSLEFQLNERERLTKTYEIKPLERGDYDFGNVITIAQTALGILARKQVHPLAQNTKSYPSFIQLKKYELIAATPQVHAYGIKKVRRIGQATEFEQIKDYVTGDDLKTINWKATAKRSQLMVNQYQEERSQNVYMLIDRGRVMKMPFDGLSLLDYAVNASLVLSSAILRKGDKAGLVSFAKFVDNKVPAERRAIHMQQILENLYNIDNKYQETDFGKLYTYVKTNVRQRSLLMIYTNFETRDGWQRQLKYLKGLAKSHLVVVIFFTNTELDKIAEKKANNLREIYDHAIAEKFAFEKRALAAELRKHGILTILTKPEDLTLNTLNKYLEIKSRGIL